jgi:hypothetical protein
MSTSPNPAPTSAIPLHLGDAADFATVRGFLRATGYDEAPLKGRTGITSIYAFKTIKDGRTTGVALTDALDLVIRLFLDGEVVPAATVAPMLPAPVRAAMERLGLLALVPLGICATVLLYPTEGVYVVSDQAERPEGLPPLGNDVVYAAVTNNTKTFLEFLPRTPCDRFLEVCGGTGIAALAATGFAKAVATADITERSAVYADFNGRLNGLDHFTSLQGDMYAPVGEALYDRIAAHPPYVPAATNAVIFRDGGVDGEELVRRAILEGVPRLAPGGILYVTCVASDRKEGRLEQRIRTLLGPLGADVDVLLVMRFQEEPVQYRVRSLLARKAPLTAVPEFAEQCRLLQIESLVYSHIYLRRRPGAAAVVTTRRRLGPRTTVAEALWALDIEAALTDPAVRAGLLDRRASVNPHSTMLMRFGYEEGWMPVEASHTAEWPFIGTVQGPFWLGDLLVRFDGSEPVRAIVSEFRERELIAPEVSDVALTTLLSALALNGAVLIEGLPPLPHAPSATPPVA